MSENEPKHLRCRCLITGALLFLSSTFFQPAFAIEGLSKKIEINFNYEQGWDAIDTPAYASASIAHNVQFSTLSDCYFMWVPDSPDGRITDVYSEANMAFCAGAGEDVIGRIDFIEPIQSLSIWIRYFADGEVTFRAFSETGVKLHEMQAQYEVGFEEADVGDEPVAYVTLSGNHMDAAINIDDVVLKTVGVERAVVQSGSLPLLFESTEFETIDNPSEPGIKFWQTQVGRGAHGGVLKALKGADRPDDSSEQASIVRYPLVLNSSGRYYLYLRAKSEAESQDAPRPRVWVSSVLDQNLPSGDLDVTLNNSFNWRLFGPIDVNNTDLNKVRNLYLGVRTPGVFVDEMVLSKNPAMSDMQLSLLADQAGRPTWDGDYSAFEFDWTQLRGNRRQTGRSKVRGTLDLVPAIKSSLNYRHRAAAIGIDLDSVSQTSLTPFENLVQNKSDAELARNWRHDTPVRVLNEEGDESFANSFGNSKFGHWLPGETSLQNIVTERVAASVTFTVWSAGGWQTLWQVQDPVLKDVVQPLIGDFDNDGAMEAAFTPWTNLWVVDLESGELEQQVQFIPNSSDNGRPYGWSGGVDLFEDDRSEFLVIGDFHNHMEVLSWNGDGNLEKRWDWMVENGISAKQTILHTGVDPTGEVISGNNMLEIVVSMFNEDNDGEWHTLVISSIDGAILTDIPNQFISRLIDVNGDGIEELMLSPTKGRLIMENAGGSIVNLASGNQQTLFSFDSGSFTEYEMQELPDNINSTTGKFRETAFVAEFDSGLPVFATWNDARTQLRFWRFDSVATAVDLGTVDSGAQGYPLEPAGFDFANTSNHDILIRGRSFDTPNSFNSDFDADVFYNQERMSTNNRGPVIGKLKADEPPAIVVDAGLGLVRKAGMSGGNLEEPWSIAGRSSSQGWIEGQSILLADISGDDNYELIVGDRDVSGAAQLTATRDGSPIWTSEFSEFQGWYPNWNESGLLTWNAGKFRGGEKDDVVVTLRRSTMHSDETHLLDGQTGIEQWARTSLWQGHIESNGRGRGVGGGYGTVVDMNLDNRDELAISYPDGVALLLGETGNSLAERWSDQIWGQQEFFKQTLPFYDSSGFPRLAVYNGSNRTAVLDEELQQVWTTGGGEAQNSSAVLADVDGDGLSEMVVVGDDWKNSIVAYNQDGSRRWTYNTQINQPYPVSADIDNDGKEEVLFTRNSQLIAIEELNGTPVQKWVWNSPTGYFLGSPALGDVDEDGTLEIVLYDGGSLWVLGDLGSPPVPAMPVIKLFSNQFEEGVLRLSWDHAAFATSYQLLIANDAGMSSLVENINLPRIHSDYVYYFKTGQYWIQLKAINPQGESMSAVHDLTVIENLNKLDGLFGDGFE